MNTLLSAGTSIKTVLQDSPLSAIDTRVLVSRVCGLTRVELITHTDRCLTSEEVTQLKHLFQRRQHGEPIAYLTGQREFYGLPFYVTPDVLIPRPETELLVDLALAHLPEHAPCSVLELGTGSGAVAIALAHTRPNITLTAIDAYPAALAIAQQNIHRLLPAHSLPIRLLHSHWYGALDQELFDLIVTNPPYIAQHDPHLTQGDLRFEPLHALTDYEDGLSAHRTLISGAPAHLAQQGWLLLEHGYDQADAVRTLFAEQGWHAIQSWRDLAGIERVTGALRP